MSKRIQFEYQNILSAKGDSKKELTVLLYMNYNELSSLELQKIEELKEQFIKEHQEKGIQRNFYDI